MKPLVFAVVMMFSLSVFAQDKPKVGAAPEQGQQKKKSKKSADKGNPKAKVGSQDWGRFTDNGNKSLAVQEQQKQAAKKKAAEKK